MNQPELGLRVAELRQAKNLTQEQLAAMCEVSPRTIQRIESGEVDPRAYTLQCLQTALDFDFGADSAANEDLWLTVLHLSSAVCLFPVALLLWSWKKNRSYRIDQQGRLVLNFHITMTLLLFAAAFLLLFGLPSLMLLTTGRNEAWFKAGAVVAVFSLAPFLVICFFCVYESVVNTVRALSGKPIHYALSIPFVKA